MVLFSLIGFDFIHRYFSLIWTVAFFIFLFTWELWTFSGPICENAFYKLNTITSLAQDVDTNTFKHPLDLKAEGIVQKWRGMGKLVKAKGKTEVSESNEGQ